MIRRKSTEVLAIVLLVAMLALSCLLPGLAEATGGVAQQYESALFGTDLITVDIQMDEDDWQDMLDNAMSEEYYPADVTINGQTFQNVGIRPKGNTSLSQVSMQGSERYSFKIEFDHYQDGQSCWGLDKLVLNNLISDATYLKEYFVYDMFAFLDTPASDYGMAEITVNGEPWGIYIALEGVEESFLMRNFGTSAGELYKPENMADMGDKPDMGDMPDIGGMPDMGDMPDMGGMPDMGDKPDMGDIPDADDMSDADDTSDKGDTPDMGDMPNMPGGMSAGGGSDLNYTDDNLDSYEAIWEGTITDTDDADHTRVVEALKKISEGDLSGVNVDLLCKYMAVQTFVVNLDSLSGNMTHNYYLYEKDGQLTLIPWDYNLTWGGFMSGDASDTINFAIDTPVSSGVSMEDRQIFAVILNDEEACALYHSYLEKLCTEYVQGGQFELTYTMLRGLLDSRVATDEHDPTAFYTAEEYTEAVEMLKTVIERRAESILGQLDGTIPSTNDGQRADSSALIDASDLDLSIMGSMMGGMGGGPDFFGGGRGSSQDQSETGAAAPPQDGQERESPA